MADQRTPPKNKPPQNPTAKKSSPTQKRSTLTTVIILMLVLGFVWLTRQWSDSGSTPDGQPVAAPAQDGATVQNDGSSAQTDNATESGDTDQATAPESDASESDQAVDGSVEEAVVEEANVDVASGPRAPPGMATITTDELPPEALETMALIETDGPFPYDKDGSTFQNREGILPPQPQGYYSEYTVETPGSSDRGARRIVGGEEGELYYTDDHYSSFSWVEQ